jgi:hypothetical protein
MRSTAAMKAYEEIYGGDPVIWRHFVSCSRRMAMWYAQAAPPPLGCAGIGLLAGASFQVDQFPM